MKTAWEFIKYYFAGVAAIGALMALYLPFTGDDLKNYLGRYWWILFLLPLPAAAAVVLYHRLRRSARPYWVALINEYLPDVKIYGPVDVEPQIETSGPVKLTRAESRAAQAYKRRAIDIAKREHRHRIDDLHAMVADEPLLLQSPVIFSARTLSFSALEVLREQDKHGYILSGSVVLVCPDRQELILHHRSAESSTYPDCIHTIGGAFQPGADRNSLKRTAHREVDEETEASVLVEDDPPMILALERPTRFIQLVFLGAPISARQSDNLRSNWEGAGIIKIPFRDLRRRLIEPIRSTRADGTSRVVEWVPSGKAHVLAWLAHGAPGAGTRPQFGSLSPYKLFDEVVSRSEE